MTHRTTALADLRRADRDRQRCKRERMRALGIPQPHQIDNALTEALSYSLAIALAGKQGVRAQPGAQQVNFELVFTTALDILIRRWRFNGEQAAKALKARVAKRPEHSNPTWIPCFPSAIAAVVKDMSTPNFEPTPVTSSRHVQTAAE